MLWLRVGPVAPPVEDRTLPRLWKGKQRKGERRQWYPPREGIQVVRALARPPWGRTLRSSRFDRSPTHGIKEGAAPSSQRRWWDRRQEPLLRGKASLIRGGATTVRRRSPPTQCPTCNRQRGDNRSWRNAGTNRPEQKAPPKARPSTPPPSTAPDASQAPPPRPTKAPPAGAHRPSAAGPPPFKAAPKPPPPAAFSNTLHWVCGMCGEVNGLHRYGCNTCSTSQHAEGNIHEHATHWICPHCQDEVSVKRTVCDCGKWRPRSAPLINHGQAAEDRFVAKGAAAARVVLNRREVVNQGAGLGLEEPPTEGSHPAPTLDQVGTTETPEEVVEVEDDEMGVTPQGTDDMVVPTHADVAAMDVDEPEVVSAYIPPTTKTPGIPAKAYPGQTVWCPPQSSNTMMSTTSRPISYSPGDFIAEPAPEPEHEGSLGTGATASSHPGPDPVPKKARGPMGDTRPLAIVLPNGEALWFTTRDIDADTPRLVIPWSLFQYLAMSKRPLSGFQSWGKVGVLYIRRVAQDILHGAQQRGSIMDRIREASRSNPLLLDLNSAYPEPHDATPPTECLHGGAPPKFQLSGLSPTTTSWRTFWPW